MIGRLAVQMLQASGARGCMGDGSGLLLLGALLVLVPIVVVLLLVNVIPDDKSAAARRKQQSSTDGPRALAENESVLRGPDERA